MHSIMAVTMTHFLPPRSRQLMLQGHPGLPLTASDQPIRVRDTSQRRASSTLLALSSRRACSRASSYFPLRNTSRPTRGSFRTTKTWSF